MSLTKQKESLLRDRDRLTAEIEELNKRVQQYQIQNESFEMKRIEYEEKCRDLYRLLDVREFFFPLEDSNLFIISAVEIVRIRFVEN